MLRCRSLKGDGPHFWPGFKHMWLTTSAVRSPHCLGMCLDAVNTELAGFIYVVSTFCRSFGGVLPCAWALAALGLVEARRHRYISDGSSHGSVLPHTWARAAHAAWLRTVVKRCISKCVPASVVAIGRFSLCAMLAGHTSAISFVGHWAFCPLALRFVAVAILGGRLRLRDSARLGGFVAGLPRDQFCHGCFGLGCCIVAPTSLVCWCCVCRPPGLFAARRGSLHLCGLVACLARPGSPSTDVSVLRLVDGHATF